MQSLNPFRQVTATLMIAIAAASVVPIATAGEADVVAAEATRQSDGNWRFSVTLRHDDAGWEHYADRWDVVGPDGTVYGERVLLHPHDNEQPFTRSLSGVAIPETVDEVIIRGNDKVHGLGGAELAVKLMR